MKKIIISVVAVIAVIAAYMLGISAGQGDFTGGGDTSSPNAGNQGVHSSSSDVTQSENLNAGDLFELLVAFDGYANSDVQKNEIEVELECKAFAIDQDFEIMTGSYNGKPVTKIGKGAICGYVYDGKVYNEIGDSFDIQGIDEEKIANIDMKQVLGVVYKICSEGDFSVTSQENDKTFRLALTGTQLADIISYMGSEIEGYSVAVTEGTMAVSLEDGALSEIEVSCSGTVVMLSMEIPLTLTITADTQGMNNATMALPQAVIDKIG